MENLTTLIPSRFLYLLLCCFLVGSVANESRAQSGSLKILVGNQGNFSDANGSLTFFDTALGNASQDVVPGLNTLIQSITLHDDKGYILSNTADRVDIFELDDFERIGQITGVASPRYMAVADNGKAYVSNLFSATVSVIDLGSNTVTGTVATGNNPEDLAVIGGNLFVANFGFGTDDSTLTVIDIATDSVVETRQTGCDGPRFLEVDNDDELWVFCNGKTEFNEDFTEIIAETNGQVVIYDGLSGSELSRIVLDVQAGTSALGQDTWHDASSQRMFFVTDAGILVFDTATNEQHMSIQINGDEDIGGIAYDPVADRLYAARITDFTSSGFVSVHTLDGVEVDRFSAGVGPTAIAFYPNETSVSLEHEQGPGEASYLLHAAYPNPSPGEVTIPVRADRSEHMKLEIFNGLGQKVSVVMDGVMAPGEYTVHWHAEGAPRGVYFYRLSTANRTETKQITLVR